MGRNTKYLHTKEKWVSYNLTGNISEMLGVLASAKGEFQLEGFTINMTSLDDIFIQATKSDLNNSYKSQQHYGEPHPVEEEDGEYVPHHEVLLERAERASLETSAVYVDPNTSTNL